MEGVAGHTIQVMHPEVKLVLIQPIGGEGVELLPHARGRPVFDDQLLADVHVDVLGVVRDHQTVAGQPEQLDKVGATLIVLEYTPTAGIEVEGPG